MTGSHRSPPCISLNSRSLVLSCKPTPMFCLIGSYYRGAHAVFIGTITFHHQFFSHLVNCRSLWRLESTVFRTRQELAWRNRSLCYKQSHQSVNCQQGSTHLLIAPLVFISKELQHTGPKCRSGSNELLWGAFANHLSKYVEDDIEYPSPYLVAHLRHLNLSVWACDELNWRIGPTVHIRGWLMKFLGFVYHNTCGLHQN